MRGQKWGDKWNLCREKAFCGRENWKESKVGFSWEKKGKRDNKEGRRSDNPCASASFPQTLAKGKKSQIANRQPNKCIGERNKENTSLFFLLQLIRYFSSPEVNRWAKIVKILLISDFYLQRKQIILKVFGWFETLYKVAQIAYQIYGTTWSTQDNLLLFNLNYCTLWQGHPQKANS